MLKEEKSFFFFGSQKGTGHFIEMIGWFHVLIRFTICEVMLFWCIILSLPDTCLRVCTRETLSRTTPLLLSQLCSHSVRQTPQMPHTNIGLTQYVPSTLWQNHFVRLAINKLSDKRPWKKEFATGPICHLEPRYKLESDAAASLLTSIFQLEKKPPWGDNCADALCHFLKLYYCQTVSMLVYVLKLQLKNFLSNLPIREESVKCQSNEWRQDCFNLWKTETFPLEEELFRRTMKAASDSTLKRDELLLASLLLVVWKLHSPNSAMSFSRSYKSFSLYSTHFHRRSGKNKVLKTMWTTLHLMKRSVLNSSI